MPVGLDCEFLSSFLSSTRADRDREWSNIVFGKGIFGPGRELHDIRFGTPPVGPGAVWHSIRPYIERGSQDLE